jgi:hypothetical protein
LTQQRIQLTKRDAETEVQQEADRDAARAYRSACPKPMAVPKAEVDKQSRKYERERDGKRSS